MPNFQSFRVRFVNIESILQNTEIDLMSNPRKKITLSKTKQKAQNPFICGSCYMNIILQLLYTIHKVCSVKYDLYFCSYFGLC